MARRRSAAVALLLIAAVGGWFYREPLQDVFTSVTDAVGDWSTRLRTYAEAEPSTELGQRSVAGESVSVLLVLGESEGEAAFVMLASDPDGPPSALVLPQDLLVAVPGFGEFRLVDALLFGGPELVSLSVANEFGLRVDAVAGLPSGAIGGGLFEAIEVDLSVPLFVEGSEDGSVTRTLPAGRSVVAPELLENLLVTKGTGDEFEWIQRQGSAWRSVLDTIAGSPPVADRITALGGPGAAVAADLLLTVAGDPEAVLATVPVSRAESSTGVEALVPAADQADGFIRNRFGHLLLRPAGRPRVEILNGNGRIGTTGNVASTVVRDGFRVVRVDNADTFDYEDTLVVAQGEHAEEFARQIVELLGRGLLFLEIQAPSGVVDVSIIVGHDIPSGQG